MKDRKTPGINKKKVRKDFTIDNEVAKELRKRKEQGYNMSGLVNKLLREELGL